MKHLLTGGTAALLLALAVLPDAATAQSWAWATSPKAGSTGQSWGEKVALDAAGNTVVTGSFSGTLVLGTFTLNSAGGDDVFVGRLSPAGIWTQAVRAGGTGEDFATALALAPDGTAVIAGSFVSSTATFGPHTLANSGSGPGVSPNAFVGRLSPAGTWTQAVSAGGPGLARPQGLALASDGSAWVVGDFGGPTTSFGSFALTNQSVISGETDIFVARLSAAGTWTQALRAGGSDTDQAMAVAVAPDGSAVVAGQFHSPTASFGPHTLANAAGTLGSADIFVGWLDAAGSWTRVRAAGGQDSDNAYAVARAADGTVTVVGTFTSPTASFGPHTLTNAQPGLGRNDAYLARLSGTGTWLHASHGGGNGYEALNDVVLGPQGQALVTGSFTSATFYAGPWALPNYPGTNTHNDILVGALDTGGTWTQLTQAGGPDFDVASGLAADAAGNVVVTGVFRGAASRFGSTTLASPDVSLFVARLNGLVLGSRPATAMSALQLSPNPAQTTVQVSCVPAPVAQPLCLLDNLGREVRRQPLPARAGTARLDVAGLAPGLYVLRCGAATARLRVE